MAMTNILVTGGTGFLGSNLVNSLIRSDNKVVVLDNNYRGTFDNINNKNNLKIIEGDIRDIEQVRLAMEDVNIIYHLAFINGTKNFYEKPSLVMDVGIKGMLNILDLIKESKVMKFILASSSEVYQVPELIPTPEEVKCVVPDVKNPRYTYGGSKIITELLLLHNENMQQIEKIIFRPHNIYGPNMGWDHVIPELLKKIFIKSDALTKNKISLDIQGSGNETRSFCYIDDAIESLLILKEFGKDGEIYNIGNDHEITIRYLIALIEDLTNIKIDIVSKELEKGSTPRRSPDLKKIKNLGFSNKVQIESGLKKTIDSYFEILKK